ncbi:MAG: type IV pilus assembly protein PilM, partial [Planctomycetes bacterium]|nr:type IV pilus assembly protein PilM [Planctomycetota bacterium]
MPSTKTVWGIDVGQCALKALRLQWRDGKLRALGFDVIEHAKILSQPDADEQALIRSALGKFTSRNSLKGSTIIISVPGQASFTRFIKLPPVETRKIPEIVRYEARQQIPFNLEDVVWDYQTISKTAAAGPREVEVGIFAMKKDIVNDYVSDFLAMRIEPDVVQMAPVALYNFMAYERKEGGGATLLMDVGAENTNLVIADGERVWIRNVPIGGNNFTNALAREFKLPFSKAESLKRHAAESKHARQVFQAMRPVFGDLLTEVQRSIGYYTSLHRDSRVQRVMALGNAFRLAGLAKYIAQNLGVDVQPVEKITALGDAEALSAPLFKENVLSFGVAFGLAIQGVGVGAIQTSLLPPEILSAKVLRRKRPFFVAAGVAVLGAVGCFAYDQVKTCGELVGRAGTAEALAKTIAAIQDDNKKQQTEFDKQKAALAVEQARIAEVGGLISRETYAYDLLRGLWAIWPYDDRWPEAVEKNSARTSLNIIEMLSASAHYALNVAEYSEAAMAGGAAAVMAPPAPAEGTPPGAPAPAAGPEPGVVVRIVGVTPRPNVDATQYLNSGIIQKLREDPRTVHLRNPAGEEEILAKIIRLLPFKQAPEYSEFSGKAAAGGAA